MACVSYWWGTCNYLDGRYQIPGRDIGRPFLGGGVGGSEWGWEHWEDMVLGIGEEESQSFGERHGLSGGGGEEEWHGLNRGKGGSMACFLFQEERKNGMFLFQEERKNGIVLYKVRKRNMVRLG